MNIKPLADRVLVLPAPAEEKVGGIIIPDTAKEKPQRGKVVATGKGTKDEEMILKEGDTVLYGKYAGTELEFDGTKYIMMRQSDVLAVLRCALFAQIIHLITSCHPYQVLQLVQLVQALVCQPTHTLLSGTSLR